MSDRLTAVPLYPLIPKHVNQFQSPLEFNHSIIWFALPNVSLFSQKSTVKKKKFKGMCLLLQHCVTVANIVRKSITILTKTVDWRNIILSVITTDNNYNTLDLSISSWIAEVKALINVSMSSNKREVLTASLLFCNTTRAY